MKINIGFGINDNYCQHCACTIASILMNSNQDDEYNFYIVSNGLTDENISKLNDLKKIHNFKLNLINFDIKEFSVITQSSNINPSAFNRIKLFQLEDIDKILYLDSDIIVRKDIKSLYATELDDDCIAGAKDILWKSLKKQYSLSSSSIYVNTGVLLINIEQTRELDILSMMTKFHSLYSNLNYGDQDFINYAFQDKILEFDIRYNYCYPYMNEYEPNYYQAIAADPSIIHYITDQKPWKPGCTCYLKSEYFKYLKHTAYYDDFMAFYLIDENAQIISMLKNINKKLFEQSR